MEICTQSSININLESIYPSWIKYKVCWKIITGVSTFAQSSYVPTAAPEENFEFKDNTDLYNDDYLTRQPVGTLPASAMYDESMMQPQKSPEIASRYTFVDPRKPNANALSDRYYMRHVAMHGQKKKQDFKVLVKFSQFHK